MQDLFKISSEKQLQSLFKLPPRLKGSREEQSHSNNISKDANSCLNNPLVYGAGKGSTTDGGNMFCSCSFEKDSEQRLLQMKVNTEISRSAMLEAFVQISSVAISVYLIDLRGFPFLADSNNPHANIFHVSLCS